MTTQPSHPRVTYQGAPGAFGEAAIVRYWGGRAHPVDAATFEDVVNAVAAGVADYAVLPVWNSTIGRIDAAWAALEPREPGASRGLRTIGELTLPIRHYLLARPGVRSSAINLVLGHPATLAQCGHFIRERALHAISSGDSAGAARALAASADDEPLRVPGACRLVDPRSTAVLASAAAAARYQLAVLACSVQNKPDNRTSFLVFEGGASGRNARW
jgi:prephenate dehydratase